MTNPGRTKIMTRLEEIVDPLHTALLVWDVQYALFNNIFNQEAFLKKTKGLIDKARSHHIPILYAKITPLSKAYESAFRTYMTMKRVGVDDPDKLPQFIVPGTPNAAGSEPPRAPRHPERPPNSGTRIRAR